MYNFFKQETKIEVFPVLYVRHLVFFPYTSAPLIISLSSFLRKKIKADEKLVLLSAKTQENKPKSLIGTLCSLEKVRFLPQEKVKLYVRGLQRAYIEKSEGQLISIRKIHEKSLAQKELLSLQRVIFSDLEILNKLGKILSPELLVSGNKEFSHLEGLLIHSFNFTVEEQNFLLSTENPVERFQRIHAKIKMEIFRRKESRKTPLV